MVGSWQLLLTKDMLTEQESHPLKEVTLNFSLMSHMPFSILTHFELFEKGLKNIKPISFNSPN